MPKESNSSVSKNKSEKQDKNAPSHRSELEYFRSEKERLEKEFDKELKKMERPPQKEFIPDVFTSMEPYAELRTYSFALDLPDESPRHSHAKSRNTVWRLCDPWVSLHMDNNFTATDTANSDKNTSGRQQPASTSQRQRRDNNGEKEQKERNGARSGTHSGTHSGTRSGTHSGTADRGEVTATTTSRRQADSGPRGTEHSGGGSSRAVQASSPADNTKAQKTPRTTNNTTNRTTNSSSQKTSPADGKHATTSGKNHDNSSATEHSNKNNDKDDSSAQRRGEGQPDSGSGEGGSGSRTARVTDEYIEKSYQLTKDEFYRRQLDRLADYHPSTRPHMKAAYFAYLSNNPGSRRAVSECVRKAEQQEEEKDEDGERREKRNEDVENYEEDGRKSCDGGNSSRRDETKCGKVQEKQATSRQRKGGERENEKENTGRKDGGQKAKSSRTGNSGEKDGKYEKEKEEERTEVISDDGDVGRVSDRGNGEGEGYRE